MPDVKVSKFLSFVLRHDPEMAGVKLDAGGWAEIAQIVAGSNGTLNEGDILAVAASSDKKRFAISKDGRRIRANQGHSIPVDLGLEALVPPEWLYHGTAKRFLETISSQGLRPMSRNHVHLSSDAVTAVQVGQRHGAPVVLQIRAQQMAEHGHVFWRSENGVWLTDTVPARYFSVV